MYKQPFMAFSYLYGLLFIILLGVVTYALYGDVKAWQQIDWIDVFSESAIALLGLFWLVLLLRSRPGGRVTQMLAIGLCCLIFSWSMDATDEFIHLPTDLSWKNWLESIPVTFAMLLLSVGIYHWHQEELAISAQMVKRERYFREHRFFDKLIPVGGASYLREQLKLAMKSTRQKQQPLAVFAVDMDDFNQINRRYGLEEGDQILQTVCQLLLLNLREQDLICRLAGDRFVVLMPAITELQAKIIADEFSQAIASLAYKTKSSERVYLSATVAVTIANQEDSDSLIKRLNLQLSQLKQTVQSV